MVFFKYWNLNSFPFLFNVKCYAAQPFRVYVLNHFQWDTALEHTQATLVPALFYCEAMLLKLDRLWHHCLHCISKDIFGKRCYLDGIICGSKTCMYLLRINVHDANGTKTPSRHLWIAQILAWTTGQLLFSKQLKMWTGQTTANLGPFRSVHLRWVQAETSGWSLWMFLIFSFVWWRLSLHF